MLGNLGVMVHFGPLTRALIAEEERCLELIPDCHRKMNAQRELFTDGRGKRQFMFIYLTDSSTSDELPRWTVERFY